MSQTQAIRNRTAAFPLQIANLNYPAKTEIAEFFAVAGRSSPSIPCRRIRVPYDSPEIQFVPRLSMIVPFQRDEVALEATLLSILESRSDADELIIVHCGDFSDPYELARDEAVVIEAEQGLPLAEQLNLASRAACSPLLQVILPGTLVPAGWAAKAIAPFNDVGVHAVALPVRELETQTVLYGLEASELPHRRIASRPTNVGGPLLTGTLIRRRSLLKLGGWCDAVPQTLIDLELALLMQAVELGTAVVGNVVLESTSPSPNQNAPSFESGKGCGMIACGYGEIPDPHVMIEPLVRRLGHLASGLMNPKLAAERLGWVLGVRDRSLVSRISERVELARQAFEEPSVVPMQSPALDQRVNTRRAA